MIFAIDSGEVEANRPPLHVNCRSVLSPLMTAINPQHEEMATDPARDPANRALAPLPKGWKT